MDGLTDGLSDVATDVGRSCVIATENGTKPRQPPVERDKVAHHRSKKRDHEFMHAFSSISIHEFKIIL